jgi:hypothetical protein
VSAPLPGMPEPPPRTPKKPPKPGVRSVRIRTQRLCEICCRAIHELGIRVAPYPRVARWRVADGDVVTRMCEAHKVECDSE